MASFDGLPIFGAAVVMLDEANPPAVVLSEYPQIHGLEIQYLGRRGRRTVVSGILEADSLANLEAVIDVWRTYQETAYVSALVTTKGATSPYCFVRQFQTVEQTYRELATGVHCQRYRAVIQHLI